jgi:hypothetical protein
MYDLLIPTHSAIEELDDFHALINWKDTLRHFIDIHNKKQGQEA